VRIDHGPKGCAGAVLLLAGALAATALLLGLTACGPEDDKPGPGLSRCLDEKRGVGC
jgi:hypothetical protein